MAGGQHGVDHTLDSIGAITACQRTHAARNPGEVWSTIWQAFGKAHGMTPIGTTIGFMRGPKDADKVGVAGSPYGDIATIFRWTLRSPQDLAPRRERTAGSALHQVAPASKGLSLSRSR